MLNHNHNQPVSQYSFIRPTPAVINADPMDVVEVTSISLPANPLFFLGIFYFYLTIRPIKQFFSFKKFFV